MSTNIKLKNRFVNDFNLPISVLDYPYFEYQLKLYDEYNDSYKKWLWLLSLIDTYYNGDENQFLDDYYQCRDKMITSIEKSEAYQDFTSKAMSGYVVPSNAIFNNIPKTSVYTKTNHGKYFLSVDLKHANFQALKYHDPTLVNNTNNYKEFLKYHLGNMHPLLPYFENSKYTRQIIFGKLNMSRNVTIQNYILYQIFNEIYNSSEFDNGNIKIHSKQVDELIFEVGGLSVGEKIVSNFCGYIAERCLLGKINVDSQLYRLNYHEFETSFGNTISVYEKMDFLTPETNIVGKIKSCTLTYFPQVFKLISGKEIRDDDLVFYYEKNLCRFLTPLKKV